MNCLDVGYPVQNDKINKVGHILPCIALTVNVHINNNNSNRFLTGPLSLFYEIPSDHCRRRSQDQGARQRLHFEGAYRARGRQVRSGAVRGKSPLRLHCVNLNLLSVHDFFREKGLALYDGFIGVGGA